MGKKKKGGKKQNSPPQKKKQAAKPKKSSEEIALENELKNFDSSTNPYTNEFRKKLRSLDKRLNKIKTLQQRDPSELNEDQLKSINEAPQLHEKRQETIESLNLMTKVAVTMGVEPKEPVTQETVTTAVMEEVSSSMMTDESAVVVPRAEVTQAEAIRKLLLLLQFRVENQQFVQSKCEEVGIPCEMGDFGEIQQLGALITGAYQDGKTSGEKLEAGTVVALNYVNGCGGANSEKIQAILTSGLN